MYVDSTLSLRCTLTDEEIAASARIEDDEDNDSDNHSDIIQSEPKITTKQAREWVDALQSGTAKINNTVCKKILTLVWQIHLIISR
jgi:hypothetical protein